MLTQKDRCIEKLEAHVRELAMKAQELEPKASQVEIYKAQARFFYFSVDCNPSLN